MQQPLPDAAAVSTEAARPGRCWFKRNCTILRRWVTPRSCSIAYDHCEQPSDWRSSGCKHTSYCLFIVTADGGRRNKPDLVRLNFFTWYLASLHIFATSPTKLRDVYAGHLVTIQAGNVKCVLTSCVRSPPSVQ